LRRYASKRELAEVGVDHPRHEASVLAHGRRRQLFFDVIEPARIEPFTVDERDTEILDGS
jgi:hypothetical protein